MVRIQTHLGMCTPALSDTDTGGGVQCPGSGYLCLCEGLYWTGYCLGDRGTSGQTLAFQLLHPSL